ncbi:MAG: sensor histidine kinase [Micropepsaceae bacterium]
MRRAAIVAACLCVAIAVRALLGQEPGATPFATFYPAVAVAALLGGFWSGLATSILGWVAAWYFFFDPPGSLALSEPQLISAGLFALSSTILISGSVWLRETIRALEQSETRYRALIDASTDVVALTDGNGAWHERNLAWESTTGGQWPDYSGERWLSSVHEDDRQELKALLRMAEGELVNAQVRIWSCQEKEWRWFRMRTVAILGRRGQTDDRIISFADIHDRKLLREQQELVTGELRHRLKNLLAVIQALLNNSLPRNNPVAAALADKFMARLRALESAGDLVIAANWHDVDLGAVVRGALAPFIDANKAKFAIQGTPLLVHEQTAGGIGLACHELATNALKYGALSGDGGRVTIDWTLEPAGADERVVWTWTESHGPAVTPPEEQGFGVRVVRAAVARERDNAVDLEFHPEGVRCRMTFVRACKPGAPLAEKEGRTLSAPR